jgi:excisionase family DNA binding protein
MLCAMTSPPVETPLLISIAAACERLHVSRRTVVRWIERGILTAHRDPFSGRIGVELSTVADVAARRVVIS